MVGIISPCPVQLIKIGLMYLIKMVGTSPHVPIRSGGSVSVEEGRKK